jgi:hypothetical protein
MSQKEFLKPASFKIAVVLDVTPCTSVESYRRFGKTCLLPFRLRDVFIHFSFRESFLFLSVKTAAVWGLLERTSFPSVTSASSLRASCFLTHLQHFVTSMYSLPCAVVFDSTQSATSMLIIVHLPRIWHRLVWSGSGVPEQRHYNVHAHGFVWGRTFHVRWKAVTLRNTSVKMKEECGLGNIGRWEYGLCVRKTTTKCCYSRKIDCLWGTIDRQATQSLKVQRYLIS